MKQIKIGDVVYGPFDMVETTDTAWRVTAGGAVSELPISVVGAGGKVGAWQGPIPTPEHAPTVPQSLTPRQAHGVVILAGLAQAIDAAINAIPDPLQSALVRNDWERGQEIRRDWPALQQLAQALQLSEAQIDELFIEGAKL